MIEDVAENFCIFWCFIISRLYEPAKSEYLCANHCENKFRTIKLQENQADVNSVRYYINVKLLRRTRTSCCKLIKIIIIIITSFNSAFAKRKVCLRGFDVCETVEPVKSGEQQRRFVTSCFKVSRWDGKSFAPFGQNGSKERAFFSLLNSTFDVVYLFKKVK